MYAPINGVTPDIWHFTHCNNNNNNNNKTNNNSNDNNVIKRYLLQYVSGMLVYSK